MWPWSPRVIHHKTAIFRQVNQNKKHVHHDALEFPDGQIVLLTLLYGGQRPPFFNCLRRLTNQTKKRNQRLEEPWIGLTRSVDDEWPARIVGGKAVVLEP